MLKIVDLNKSQTYILYVRYRRIVGVRQPNLTLRSVKMSFNVEQIAEFIVTGKQIGRAHV